MSGLEPLAGLGLACNVFQVLSFANEVCVVSRAICEKGETPDSAESLAKSLSNLSAIITGIERSTNSTPQPLSENDMRMLHIAQDCSKAALELKTEIDKISRAASLAKGRTFKSILVATWSVVRSRTKLVERLEKRLQTHQNTLETQLLVNICSKADAAKICQEERFKKLDATLCEFIKRFSDGEIQMSALVIQHSEFLKTHITKETAALTMAMNDLSMESKNAVKDLDNTVISLNFSANRERKRETLVKSLKYPTMNDRRNQIVDPHAETFEWLFTGAPKLKSDVAKGGDDGEVAGFAAQQNPSLLAEASVRFTGWLRDPNRSLFWITGKPGSGKSTLIKFLALDPRIRSGLASSEYGGRESVILSHFIWSAGLAIESSIKGMLLSLTWQLLHKDTALSDSVLEKFPETREKDSFSDWSEKELRIVLHFLLTTPRKAICLFIDGLDEISKTDGQGKLIEIINEIRGASNAKICLSSRPEPILQKHFGAFPSFRMQDLTEADIFRFTSSILQKHISGSGIHLSRDEHWQLVHQVCFMAEGVFLWVILAVRNLVTGLDKGDSMDELQQRLHMMPAELRDLYRVMRGRSGTEKEIYQRDAARYFNLVATSEDTGFPFIDCTPLLLLLATDGNLSDMILSGGSQSFPTEYELQTLVNRMAHRVEVRCLGLLDVRAWENTPREMHIRFTHRSAKEFLETDAEGQALLELDISTKAKREFSVLKGQIAHSFLHYLVNKDIACFFSPDSADYFMHTLLNSLERDHPLESEALDLCMLSRPFFPPYHRVTLEHASIKRSGPSSSAEPGLLVSAARTGFLSFVKQAVVTRSCWGVATGALTAPYLTYLFIAALGGRLPYTNRCPLMHIQEVRWFLKNGVQPNLPLVGLDPGIQNFVWQFPKTPFKLALKRLILPSLLRVDTPPFLEILTALAKAGGDLSSPLILVPEPPSPSRGPVLRLQLMERLLQYPFYIGVSIALVIELVVRKYARHTMADMASVEQLLAMLDGFATPELSVRKVTIDSFSEKGDSLGAIMSEPKWSTNEPGLMSRVEEYLKADLESQCPPEPHNSSDCQDDNLLVIKISESWLCDLVESVRETGEQVTWKDLFADWHAKDLMWRHDDPRARVPDAWEAAE